MDEKKLLDYLQQQEGRLDTVTSVTRSHGESIEKMNKRIFEGDIQMVLMFLFLLGFALWNAYRALKIQKQVRKLTARLKTLEAPQQSARPTEPLQATLVQS